MTLSATTKANRKNAKKSTGPKSLSGKLAISKNATTHGVNTKTFINDAEENEYQTLVHELKATYPSSNPLVRIQIERIAKVNIQLNRIQKAIDATFAYSEAPNVSDDALMDLLGMNPSEREKAQDICEGKLTINGMVNIQRIRIAAELAHIDTSKFTSHDEFLDHAPALCKYLFNEATSFKQNIDYFVTHHAATFVNLSELGEKIHRMLVRMNALDDKSKEDELDYDDYGLPILPDVENSIRKVKLENLKTAAESFSKEINKLAEMHYKCIVFNQLRQASISPLTLNYSHLDSLQRYQTPLNNQLSKMMGELLVLVK